MTDPTTPDPTGPAPLPTPEQVRDAGIDLPTYRDVTIVDTTDDGNLYLSGYEHDRAVPDGRHFERLNVRWRITRLVAFSRHPAAALVWTLADGFGDIPPAAHEYDPSALRDATDHSKLLMYAAAQTALPRETFLAAAFAGTDVEPQLTASDQRTINMVADELTDICEQLNVTHLIEGRLPGR